VEMMAGRAGGASLLAVLIPTRPENASSVCMYTDPRFQASKPRTIKAGKMSQVKKNQKGFGGKGGRNVRTNGRTLCE
jgi:hypothetical protein